MPQWFDTRPSITFTNEDGMASPGQGGTVPTYTPRKPGILSTLGDVGNAALAPWVQAYGGNMDYSIQQQKLQAQQDMADMEFQKYLMQINQKNEIDPSKALQMAIIGKLFPGIMPNDPSTLQGPAGSLNLPSTPGQAPFGQPVNPSGLSGSSLGLNTVDLGPLKYKNIDLSAQEQARKDIQESSKGVANSTATFNMMNGIMGDLMSIYDQADKAGFAGDMYRAGLGDLVSSGALPKELSSKFSQSGIDAVSSFIARRNELMTRMQPLLSGQFDKEGSNRIMESLLKLADKELSKLKDPRSAAIGKNVATLENFYRFAKGSADYADKIKASAGDFNNADTKQVDSFINGVMNDPASKLTKEEKNYFQGIKDQFLKKRGSSDVRSKYNALREKGVSIEDAKKQLGL